VPHARQIAHGLGTFFTIFEFMGNNQGQDGGRSSLMPEVKNADL